MASVPPKVENANIANPKNRTTDEYIILKPVSRKAEITDSLIFQLVSFNSIRYLDRKCIALSTDIPNAILKIKIVEGFIGISRYPIIAAVSRRGIRLGTSETRIILGDVNSNAINNDITPIDNNKLVKRLFIR